MKVSTSNIIALFLGLIAGIFFTLIYVTLSKQTRPAPIIINPPATVMPAELVEPTTIKVYINGAVRQAAVYELPPNSIVGDVVTLAGGFSDEAETAGVNLAASLTDGMQIWVPAIGEAAAAQPLLSSAVAPESGNAGTVNAIVNINTASAGILEGLPGIGPSTAERIITYRTEHGPFAAIEAIMDVPTIGEAKFERIKPLITVGE